MPAAASRQQRRCPSCQGPLRQVHRRPEDLDSSLGEDLRRFRCRDAECGWEGLLARAHRRAASSRRARQRAAVSAPAAQPRLARIATVLLLLLTAAVVVAVLWARGLAARP
jgi:hypothetical protein